MYTYIQIKSIFYIYDSTSFLLYIVLHIIRHIITVHALIIFKTKTNQLYLDLIKKMYHQYFKKDIFYYMSFIFKLSLILLNQTYIFYIGCIFIRTIVRMITYDYNHNYQVISKDMLYVVNKLFICAKKCCMLQHGTTIISQSFL